MYVYIPVSVWACFVCLFVCVFVCDSFLCVCPASCCPSPSSWPWLLLTILEAINHCVRECELVCVWVCVLVWSSASKDESSSTQQSQVRVTAVCVGVSVKTPTVQQYLKWWTGHWTLWSWLSVCFTPSLHSDINALHNRTCFNHKITNVWSLRIHRQINTSINTSTHKHN